MHEKHFFMTLLLGAATACNQGYKSADDLRADERGPEHCAQSCHELGMRMSAFVLVEHGTSGCVCSPTTTGGGLTGSTAGVAASHVVLEEARRQAQAQQQAQTTTLPAGAP